MSISYGIVQSPFSAFRRYQLWAFMIEEWQTLFHCDAKGSNVIDTLASNKKEPEIIERRAFRMQRQVIGTW